MNVLSGKIKMALNSAIHGVVSYSKVSNSFECCEKKSICDTDQGNSRMFVC